MEITNSYIGENLEIVVKKSFLPIQFVSTAHHGESCLLPPFFLLQKAYQDWCLLYGKLQMVTCCYISQSPRRVFNHRGELPL